MQDKIKITVREKFPSYYMPIPRSGLPRKMPSFTAQPMPVPNSLIQYIRYRYNNHIKQQYEEKLSEVKKYMVAKLDEYNQTNES